MRRLGIYLAVLSLAVGCTRATCPESVEGEALKFIVSEAGAIETKSSLTPASFETDNKLFTVQASVLDFTSQSTLTKGTEITTASLEDFNVDAYLLTPVSGLNTHYVSGGQARKTSDEWFLYPSSTSDAKIAWVDDGHMGYWCRKGVSPTFGDTNPSQISFDYSVGASETGDDIILAYSEASTSTANLTFYHPLSAVEFTFDDVPSYYDVVSVTVKDVNAGGTCTVNASSLQNPSWTLGTDVLDYSASCTSTSTVLFFAPQTFTGGLSFEISLEDNSVSPAVSITLEASTTDSDVTTWLAGKKYVFNISFSQGLDVTVTPSSTSVSTPAIANNGGTVSWVRAAIVGAWYDGEDIVAPWVFDSSLFTGLCASGSGWVAGSDGLYYYTSKVYPRDVLNSTNLLFTSFTRPVTAPVTGAQFRLSVLAQSKEFAGEASYSAVSWSTSE